MKSINRINNHLFFGEISAFYYAFKFIEESLLRLKTILFLSIISASSYAKESNQNYTSSCNNLQNDEITHSETCLYENMPEESNENNKKKSFLSLSDVLIKSAEDVGVDQIKIKGEIVNYSNVYESFLNDIPLTFNKENGQFETSILKEDNGKYDFTLFSDDYQLKERSYFSHSTLKEKSIININNEGSKLITNTLKNKLNSEANLIEKTLIQAINVFLEKHFDKAKANNLLISIKEISLSPVDLNILSLNLTVSNIDFSFDLLGIPFKGVAGPLKIKSTINLNNDKIFSTQSVNIQTVIVENQDLPGVDIGASMTSSFLRDLVNNLFQKDIILTLDSIFNEQVNTILADISNVTYTLEIPTFYSTHKIDFNLSETYLSSTKNHISLYSNLRATPQNPRKETIIRFNKNETESIQAHNYNYNLLMNSNVLNEILYAFHSGNIFNITTSNNNFTLGKDIFEDKDTAKIDFTSLPWVGFDSRSNLETIEVNADDILLKIRMNNQRIIEEAKSYGVIKEINNGELISNPNGTTLITSTLALKLNVNMSVDNSKLNLNLNGLNSMKIKKLEIGTHAIEENALNFFNSFISDIASEEINKLLKTIVDNYKSPTINCLALKEMKINNGKDKHLNIGINLEVADNSCDVGFIESPKAYYNRGVGTIPTHCKSGDENNAALCYPKCKSGFSGVGPLCWNDLKEYGRGVGEIPTDCGTGKERDAGLCYPVCKNDYHGIGPVCWSNKSKSYGRGVGTIPSNIFTGRCPSNKENNAGLCYTKCDTGYRGVGPVCWLNEPSYGRGVGTIANQCSGNKENDAGLCYPKCQSEYNGIGPMCWPKTLSYGRGVGKIPICAPDKEKSAGLCHTPCLEGYNGISSICHPIF